MWDTTKICTMSECDPPPDYPADILAKNLKLRQFKLTFENLNRVIEYSSDKFENGHWSEKEVMSYTSSHGINKLGQKN